MCDAQSSQLTLAITCSYQSVQHTMCPWLAHICLQHLHFFGLWWSDTSSNVSGHTKSFQMRVCRVWLQSVNTPGGSNDRRGGANPWDTCCSLRLDWNLSDYLNISESLVTLCFIYRSTVETEFQELAHLHKMLVNSTHWLLLWDLTLQSLSYSPGLSNHPKQQHNVSANFHEKKRFLSQLFVPEATRLKFLIFQQRGDSAQVTAPARLSLGLYFCR